MTQNTESKESNKPSIKKYISVKGARVHNLKNIDIDLPRNQLTVITGVSGSGKSSLAFDTLYAEGQRRFVESLSAYARQFLERMQKPDADAINGLPPAVAIGQNVSNKNPRSTVGTTTEIYDYIRLLYGRIGETIDYVTGQIVRKDTPDSVVKDILERFDEEDKLLILFPLSLKTFNLQHELEKYREMGFSRFVIGDSPDIIDLNEVNLEADANIDDVFILADRIKLRKDVDSIARLNESIEAAFRSGGGRVSVRNLSKNETRKFSTAFECADSGIVYEEPAPNLFSFNNPHGACPKCQGYGRTVGIDENLVIPDRSRSIRQDALHPFKGEVFSKYKNMLINIAPNYGIDVNLPISDLSEDDLQIIWNGANEYPGLNGFFKILEDKNYKMHYRVILSRYRGYTKCKACGGSRIRTSARQVYVGGKNVPEIINMPLEKALDFFKTIELTDYRQEVAGQVLTEIIWRLQLLVDIGLEYLTLARLAHTLSGGESQRINLATALGSQLVSTMYVLDEPSIGMHPRDTQRLINILFKLRNLGNTVLVVEHAPDIIRVADNIVDMGPDAGEHGGGVVFSGSFEDLLNSERSYTAKYFNGELKIQIPEHRNVGNGRKIIVHKPRENNLKIDTVVFPLGNMVAVTGVSGSGKSTLVHDILYAGLKRNRGGYQGTVGKYGRIEGGEEIENLEFIDQSPIGRSSRSTPASYTKVFDTVRELFASTQAARQLGLKPGYFSFNVPGGRCEECEGDGIINVDMQFLPNVTLPCESCRGTRYKLETRNLLYKGKSIVDVLAMTVDEAYDFFQENNKIERKLSILKDIGLGYLQLGQPSTMLSGGESQRIKLAGHMESSSNQTLFIFDEPTTGLHMHDISKLIEAFRKLVRYGHSVIIIEHNLHLIAASDWVIDLGPEAGERGGSLTGSGTPEEITKIESHTGKALKEFFERELL